MAGIKKGKLIVIEGNDGSGKTTQIIKLQEYLKKNKIPFKVIDFPRYDSSFFGKFLAEFLRGEHGKLEDVNPYLLTFPFALDRFHAAPKINEWLNKGFHVLANRYVPSNLAHQSGRLPVAKRNKYIDWASELEYKINKLPKEDLVIFLHVPYKVSLKLMEKRKNRSYTKGKVKDIAESDLSYIKNAELAYLNLLDKFSHWKKISCVEKNELKSIDRIHEEIKHVLKLKKII